MNFFSLGYLGLFLGSFLASTIVPFSADALLVGCLAIGLNTYTCLFLATLGNWLGGMTTFLLGWIGNLDHIEKWFKVNAEKIRLQQPKIEKFGACLAFLAWLPIVGDVFAIALGFYRINWKKCAFWMLLGRLIRFVLWTWLYFKFGEQFFSTTI